MKRKKFLSLGLLFVVFALATPFPAMAQASDVKFRPEELDQMLAPIALYPDSLLAQMLAASTYPMEIVQAARFAEKNKNLKGDKLIEASKSEEWDPSVKAMLGFPDVLAMMNEKLDWTEDLGNAFLAQQKDVMDSVQRLRSKASGTGNLKTTKEQVVKVEPQTQVIVIQPASPQVVYVPTYNPTVVYGAWPYPAYPPYPYYPPGYRWGTAAFSFALGVAVGAGGGCWGCWGCGWRGGDVDINVNRYNNFTKNNYVNSGRYQRNAGTPGQKWQHNPEHRRGAQYRDQRTAQKFGQQNSRLGNRPSTSDSKGFDRGGAGGGQAGSRDSSRGGGRDTAFGNSNRGGGSDRASSTRGQASRSSSSRSAGGSRGGGGTSRGGGGRSGGGGRRR